MLIRLASRNARRCSRKARCYLESLESRTLLSSTLFVTSPAVTPDATHFQTLQSALAVAINGDTIVLQTGFFVGSFVTTFLSAPVDVGATVIHTLAALDVGDVVTIGANNSADPAERALVVAVTASPAGDYLVTLADPLQFAHVASPVDATNAASIGKTVGIAKAITLTADAAGVTLPFNLELWRSAGPIALSNLNFTAAPATSLFVDNDGNTLANLKIANQLVLSDSDNNALTGLTVSNRLLVDTASSGNSVSDSTLKQVALRNGSSNNSFTHNTIASVVATGGDTGNGFDIFQQNTFTGLVNITGNLSAPTYDVFIENTFTAAASDALKLTSVSGAHIADNTFNLSKSFARAITIANSTDVVITNNHITATGSGDTAISAFADAGRATSVDVLGNVITTGDGYGIIFAKSDVTATLEARVQDNDLRGNVVGVLVVGDGVAAGNVDLGGGLTSFGIGEGRNDFSSFTSTDDSHYAIGLVATDAAFTLLANNNTFAVPDPLAVVSDSLHNLPAGGTGVILATATVTETLTLAGTSLSLVQTQLATAPIAHLTSDAVHDAADFLVTVTSSDGLATPATLVANPAGGFDVCTSRAWNTAGTFSLDLTITTNTGLTSGASSTMTVSPRVLALSTAAMSIEKGSTFSGPIATFTDNLPNTSASSYTVIVRWSDGLTTPATLTRNPDGSYSVHTTRPFSTMGTVTATITISTTDNLFTTTLTQDWTITNKNNKVPPGKKK